MAHYDDVREESEEKNKGGRPPVVLNDEQIAQVEALGAMLSIEQIADYFGITKVTFYAIMERQPDVSIRYKRGKAKAIGSVSKGLLQKAQSGDTASAIFYLKTQAGWREKVPEGVSNINVMSNLTDEQLEAAIKRLQEKE